MHMHEKCDIVSMRNKEVVVRVKECIKMYAKAYDKEGRNIGRLVRVFGPVSKPYGLIRMNPDVKNADEIYVKC